ncbi:hypothetical protein HYPBUDRAFT_112646 [Hyphopichia burtonii NRRL Y-1933]|uniref:Uncharacterized protein n=1 Tax=Hyphopichia burtonii NRRL Y-1933 TaxID=984485 RepID=A0A1E4RFT8_9ASCO|nr:hypothetical protein HYPBUDRAFT_112646 [Hyphopichia burtonii NRRL Y-1933]ODV66132.1 hypothetical protein HYPBUDRAFT_112646 [Hyphopichia burtonii NRRL Y-1933]
MVRPPPKSLEDFLYYKLLDSRAFNNFVRRVHARINRIPYYELDARYNEEHMKLVKSFNPTAWHKFKAFRTIWWDEMKRSFTFRS